MCACAGGVRPCLRACVCVWGGGVRACLCAWVPACVCWGGGACVPGCLRACVCVRACVFVGVVARVWGSICVFKYDYSRSQRLS